jgi:chromosome segregation ATPase
MSKIVRPVGDPAREEGEGTLDAAARALETVRAGLDAGRRRIAQLEESLARSEAAREQAEKKAEALDEKLKRILSTLES